MAFTSPTRPLPALLLALGLATSCSERSVPPTPPAPSPPPDAGPAQKPRKLSTLEAQGLSLEAIDRSIDPCDDFYQFACGGWEQRTPIPDDQSRWFRSFSEIDRRNEAELRAILEEASAKPGDASATGRLGRFYAACMDEAQLETSGLEPIAPLLASVKSVRGADATLVEAIATLHRHGIWAFFDVAANQDYRDATKMIGALDQNGLGLPDRDDYLSDSAEKVALREKYRAHVERMFVLAGRKQADAKKAAEHVLRIETALARASKSRVERRDPKGMYNKVDRPGLATLAPTLGWDAYFQKLGAEHVVELSVTSPKFFEGLDAIVRGEKAEALREYLTWHVLRVAAPRLGKAFQDEDFALVQTLTGQKVQRERFKRCIDATDEALGELLAQPFVLRRFAGESKQAAEGFVRAIAAAMRTRLDELSWMDGTTRTKAVGKLEAMAYLIGYPDRWKAYDFEVGASHLGNVLAGRAFRVRDDLGQIGKPVDRGRWYMTPPTVNAYYDAQKNQMVFPAGILQPPFYSAQASVPVNLGAMGMVVGHELTHGFDDEGSQFDAVGNLSSWWSPTTRATFEAKGSCVEAQYAAYEALPGVRLDGKLTLGENIADSGGLELAYRAYRQLRADAPEEVVADGFGEDQQFFLATGQIWCAKYRDEAAKLMAQTDPHAHPRWRVNGPMSHSAAFARAFECRAGQRMVAQETCTVW